MTGAGGRCAARALHDDYSRMPIANAVIVADEEIRWSLPDATQHGPWGYDPVRRFPAPLQLSSAPPPERIHPAPRHAVALGCATLLPVMFTTVLWSTMVFALCFRPIAYAVIVAGEETLWSLLRAS